MQSMSSDPVVDARAHAASFRPVVRELVDYEPGRDIEEVAEELGVAVDDIVKMASNESPFGPSPAVLKAIPTEFGSLHMYPWKRFTDFKETLARHHGLSAESIVLGHGTEALISSIPQLYVDAGDEIVVATESYALHGLSCVAMAATVRSVPLRGYRYDVDAMVAQVNERTKILWLCNPNNPTATIITRDEMDDLLTRVPEAVAVVVDGAYAEYADDPEYGDGIALVREGRPNVIALRTMSKAYGLAGLRIGYAAAHPEVCRMLDRLREPFNMSRVATAAGPAALADVEWLCRCQRLNCAGRDYLTREFERLGFDVVPSQANFILVDVKRSGDELFAQLLARGIIVRPASAWGFDTHIRATVGTLDQNRRLISALDDLLSEGNVPAAGDDAVGSGA
jgi:histidinol-phosphate aminotransferase